MKDIEKESPEDFTPLTDEESAQVWSNVIHRVHKMEQQKKVKQQWMAGMALVLLSFAGLFGYDHYFRPGVFVAGDKIVNVQLKDGSKITLHEGARLTVEKTFNKKTRDVYLEGTALFRVARSEKHPFIVHGINYEMKVLGTTFKVVQNHHLFDVELYEGKVAVSRTGKAHEAYYLKKDQAFRNFGNSKVAVVLPRQPKEDLPGNGIALHFDGSPFSEAVSAIEQAYHVKVVYPETFTHRPVFNSLKNMPVEAVLQTLAIQMNLTLTYNEGKYRLED